MELNFPSVIQTQVLIIGGGVTGTALARDLALRGVDCILVEKDDINAGASGRNHGLLHSGARYVAGDASAAMECRAEGDILKRVAAQTIQDTGGYFVAVQGDDERYVADFPAYCARSGISARAVDVALARQTEPALSERTIAVFEVSDAAIDPFRLSLESMAQARSLGARLLRRTRVLAFERDGRRIGAVRVQSQVSGHELRIEAVQVVNAAGAWADEFAHLAGAVPLGLVPKRRTAFYIPAPDGIAIAGWPLINDVGEEFYFKPDAGQLFVSPADATPSPAMDAYPDDLDVAIGVDRLERATTLTVRRVSNSWAGLRTFAVDGSPVVGADGTVEGFFWLAAQGGYGIKTSPSLSRACATLIRHGRLPDDLEKLSLTPSDLSPQRLRDCAVVPTFHTPSY